MDRSTPATDRLPPFDASEILDAGSLDDLAAGSEVRPLGWATAVDAHDDEDDDTGEQTVVTAPPFALRPAFTGRTWALRRLIAAFDAVATEGRLRFAMVIGAPGSGRSRLVEELLQVLRARRVDAALLVSSGDERGGPSAIARLLAQRFAIGDAASAAEARAHIGGAVAAVLPPERQDEVAHLLAHLLGVPLDGSPVVSALAASPRQLETRTFLAVRRFLAADARLRPLVLVIDDLDRCAVETVHLLQYLAAGLAGAPVLLVATAGPTVGEIHPGLGDADAAPEAIALEPLTPVESEALLRELLRPAPHVPPVLLAHARELGGSPRALHDLVHWLRETGCLVAASGIIDTARLAATVLPGSAEALVTARLAAMDAQDRRLLEMAAAIGDADDPIWPDAVVALHRRALISATAPDGPTLAEIDARGDDGVAARLMALGARGWLAPASPRHAGQHALRFAYPHLRDAVVRAADPEAVRRHHGAVACWLELSAAAAPETVARHLERAGDLAEAAARYRRAADDARSAFRNQRAVELYRRALACLGDHDLAARLDLWHDLGAVHERVGDFDAALGAFERVQRLAWVAASDARAAVAWNRIGRIRRRQGDPRRALDALERGHALFRAAGDSGGVASSADDIAAALMLVGRTDEAFQHVTRALAVRGKAGEPRAIAASLTSLGRLQHRRGQLEAAATCHRDALALWRQAGDRAGIAVSGVELAALGFERGELSASRTAWTTALAEAEALGDRPLTGRVLGHLGELALAEGRLDEAQRRLVDARAVARDLADRALAITCGRLLALVESHAGRQEAACDLAELAVREAADARLPEHEALALVALAQVLSASLYDADRTDITGVPGESPAEAYFRRAVELLRTTGSDLELAKAQSAYGRFLLENGKVGDAKLLLRAALAALARSGAGHAADVERLLGSV